MSTKTTPIFEKKILMPGASSPEGQYADHCILELRYYAPYGEEWKIPLTPASVDYNGNNVMFNVNYAGFLYSSNHERYLEGQIGNGFDQYAQYYESVDIYFASTPEYLTLTGNFQRCGYFSAVIYMASPMGLINGYLIESKDFEFDSPSNPYIEGNNSVFSYDKSISCVDVPPIKKLIKTTHTPSLKNDATGPYRDDISGLLYLFRSNVQSLIAGEDIAPDGCSRAYLVARPLTSPDDASFTYMILRIKVPSTFVHQTAPDLPDSIFGNYDCRQLSVSSTLTEEYPSDQRLEFWTINSAMLEATKDSDGYAYVFFAPTDFVRSTWNEQGSPECTPPQITWGNYSGYLLGLPVNNIIIRYRAASSTWQGTPENATCYLNPQTSEPVIPSVLGEYYPAIYSDTEANFLAGNIGNVNSLLPWPELSK